MDEFVLMPKMATEEMEKMEKAYNRADITGDAKDQAANDARKIVTGPVRSS